MKANEPPRAALRWAADAVGPGATIQSVRLLAGATSSTLHSLEVAYRGRSLKLVLSRFTNAEWLREEPDLATHEAANLKKAAEAAVATPELIAYDATGEQCGCGVPAILMSQLPGSVELMPADFDNWLYRMAEVLITIHALEAGIYPWSYAPYNDSARLVGATWAVVPAAYTGQDRLRACLKINHGLAVRVRASRRTIKWVIAAYTMASLVSGNPS
jgi:hypothetical protein